MAGEWLKFESNLPDKPETLAITAAMGWDDPDLTVGKLMRVFRWFDQQTIDGNARGVTPALLDRVIGVTGLVQAMADSGWIDVTSNGLCLKNFERHNGASAKSRAQTAKRVANHRAEHEQDQPLSDRNAATVTPALAREEKSREEKREDKEKAPRKRDASPEVSMPDDVTEQVWNDWVRLRKKKRADVSETTLAGARAEAQKAGVSLQRFLEIWCLRGSTGLQAEWLRANERSPSGSQSGETPYQKSQRERVAEFAPSVAKRQESIDAEASNVLVLTSR